MRGIWAVSTDSTSLLLLLIYFLLSILVFAQLRCAFKKRLWKARSGLTGLVRSAHRTSLGNKARTGRMILRRFTPFSHAVFSNFACFLLCGMKADFLRFDCLDRVVLLTAKFVLFSWSKPAVNFSAVIAPQSPGTSRPRPYDRFF